MVNTITFQSNHPNIVWQLLDAASEDKFRQEHTYLMCSSEFSSEIDISNILKTLAELCDYHLLTTNLFCSLKTAYISKIEPLVFEMADGRKLEICENSRIRLLSGDTVNYVLSSTIPDTFERVQSFFRSYLV